MENFRPNTPHLSGRLTPAQSRRLTEELVADLRSRGAASLAELAGLFEAARLGKPGGISPADVSLRRLAAEAITSRDGQPVGDRFVEDYFAPQGGMVLEAGAGVSTTAFSNITGQIVYSAVLAGFEQPEFVASRLIPDRPTQLNEEKIPGVQLLRNPERDSGSDALVVGEMQEYPTFGFGEEFVQMPVAQKRGMIVPVTREAIFFDRTGLVASRAAAAGSVLGLSKENRLTDVLIGATNPYKEFRRGMSSLTSRNTYYAAADSGPWTNYKASTALTDWTSVEEAEKLFAEMTDPNTGEPIALMGGTIIVPPHLAHTARRILNATEIKHGADSATVQMMGPNPLAGSGYRVEVSAWLYRRLQESALAWTSTQAQGTWLLGDVSRAFSYARLWPLQVVQAPSNSEPEFTQDVILRFKASEYGAAEVQEPRRMTRFRAAAA